MSTAYLQAHTTVICATVQACQTLCCNFMHSQIAFAQLDGGSTYHSKEVL